ncbi:alpha/beta fold hydrolase [Sphingomonas sp. UYP23]
MFGPQISRREALGAGLALALAVRASASSISASSPGRLLTVNGTRLYVEDLGPREAPALVYLHGGPGVGCYEFSSYAGALLARGWRLIAFDQRGVLRSDPLPADARYGMDDLVADIEALRETLGVARWSLLGHSFGGHYALRYALRHPTRVSTMYLENPAYSFPESTRSTLRATSALYAKLGKVDLARQAMELAGSDLPPRTLLDRSMKGMGGLGEERQQLYLYDQRYRGFFGRLQQSSGISDARWGQGQAQATKLFDDGQILEPMLASMSAWRGPVVLLKGATDHVTSAEEVATVAALPRGRIVQVPRAGHFIHVEQPAALNHALSASVAGLR